MHLEGGVVWGHADVAKDGEEGGRGRSRLLGRSGVAGTVVGGCKGAVHVRGSPGPELVYVEDHIFDRHDLPSPETKRAMWDE